MAVDPAPAGHRGSSGFSEVAHRTVGAVLAGTANPRRRVAEDDSPATPVQLDPVAVHLEEQAGAGTHLDEDDGTAGPVPARESE